MGDSICNRSNNWKALARQGFIYKQISQRDPLSTLKPLPPLQREERDHHTGLFQYRKTFCHQHSLPSDLESHTMKFLVILILLHQLSLRFECAFEHMASLGNGGPSSRCAGKGIQHHKVMDGAQISGNRDRHTCLH